MKPLSKSLDAACYTAMNELNAARPKTKPCTSTRGILAELERPSEAEVKQALQGILVNRDARAVNQAVQRRQVLQGVVEGGAVGDVQAQGVAAQLRQGIGVAAEGKNFGTAGDQLPGNFAADATAGASDENALVGEVEDCVHDHYSLGDKDPLWE